MRNLFLAAALGAALVVAGVALGSRTFGEYIQPQPIPSVLPLSSFSGGGLAHVYKFGANPAVGTNYEDIWDGGGVYSWLTSPITMQLSSSSANDDLLNTGAQTVTIQGLDANYNEITDSFTMNGQSAVGGSKTFLRVYRAWVSDVLTAGNNVGTIYVSTSGATLSSGVPSTPSTIKAQIGITNGQTLMALYTVPASYNGRVLGFTVGNDDDSKATTFQLLTREVGKGWRVKWQGVTNGTPYNEVIQIPSFRIKPKTDVRIRAKTDTNTAVGNATFQLSLD